MKNNYLLLSLLSALTGYGQFPQGFENNGDQLSPGWSQLNIAGPQAWWRISEAGNTQEPPYEGSRAAYLAPEDVATGTSEDWLVTLQFIVPENAQFTFYSRLLQEGDQGTTYRLMLHLGNTPSDPASYIQLQHWTELQINPEQLQYTPVTVPIPAMYSGMQAYIAFVMNGDNGDGWLVDDVGIQGIMGSQEVNIKSSLSFYPNPVKDRLFITGTDEVLSLHVVDSNGRECITNSGKGFIDMSGLAAGLYIVKAVTAKGTVIRKVLKE
ncbi:choice-of-anchor J domain-containing protein [Flavobacterium sp.]|uniref:choice-of-anchor J domain-containing protein n=1 Tax=Flavobacterium sp. TaxID=239 RepID=UPI0040342CE6